MVPWDAAPAMSQCTKWFAVVATLIGMATFVGVAAQTQAPWFETATYWQAPLAPQGAPPNGWTEIERSLAPADCGQCHAAQLQQWSTSRHAQAFSPGLVGQLLNLDASDAAECLQCHAPLAEQRNAFEAARAAGLGHRPDRQGLAAAGNSCSGCHVRQHRRFGPPQRGTGAVGPSANAAPHGGVVRTNFFESSEFCSGCHQFAANTAVNGKPLQNTYAEWQASPQAARGITCQSCHMPDRQHVWRGIHDAKMVESGLAARALASAEGVRFQVVNTGIGHAFPTYTVPRVALHGVALDGTGTPRIETLRSHVIGRSVRHDGTQWIEVSDTRLLPQQSAVLEMPWSDADRIRVWLEVAPDHFYEAETFRLLLEQLAPDSEAGRLIAQAKAAAAASGFRLFESELRRPRPR